MTAAKNAHNFGTWVKEDETTHVHSCTNEGCEFFESKNHADEGEKDHLCDACGFEMSTCSEGEKHDQKCDVCGKPVDCVHSLVATPAKPATCTDDGNNAYWTCTHCERVYADAQATQITTVEQQKIAAIGHDWNETTYTFAPDGSACTATRTCKNNAEHVESATASITSEVKTPATCTEKGVTTYTATFTEAWAQNRRLTRTLRRLDMT